MGTRADFYIGRGKDAEWLGSVAWDGHPENFRPIMIQVTEKGFREMVAKELAGRDDATLPEHGWTWPWNDSGTTDYAYAFDDGKAYTTCFGDRWGTLADYEKECASDDEYKEAKAALPRAEFPDMSERKNVTLGKRSGVLIFGC